jgi:hypothetical protein
MTARTLLDFEKRSSDCIILTAIYEDELIEEPQRRESIIENIERQKEQLLVNILGSR